MANIVSFNNTIDGTASADIIIAEESSSPFTDNVINAGAGNDVILADHDAVFVDTGLGNPTAADAINIDNASFWSTIANLDVGNSTIPYTTIVGTGAGEFDYYSVTIGAGQTITLDIDYGESATGYGGPNIDTELRLFGTDGTTQIATNDDSASTNGGLGSFLDASGNSHDSYLTFTATTAGTYYFRVEQFNDSPVSAGNTYLLNVSVTNHAVTNSAVADDDTVYGGAGNDIIQGGGGNDHLYGEADDDRIYGEIGADILYGGTGVNYLDGGSGSDTASYYDVASGVVVSLAVAGAQATGVSTDTLVSIENLSGSQFADTLTGDVNANILTGNQGDDTLIGGAGNDTFNVGLGHDTVDGGADTDTLVFTHTSANWTINLGTATASSTAGAIVDFSGIEVFDTTSGYGNDTITSVGTVTIRSGTGNDTVYSSGNDFIDTGADNDAVYVGVGSSAQVDGGTGVDTLYTTKYNIDYTVNLVTGFTNYGTENFLNFENLVTGNGNDTLTGTNEANYIYAGGGIDTVDGAGGDDIIAGGTGADVLHGGSGSDTLDYSLSSAAISFDTAINVYTGGDLTGDTFDGFEKALGTAFNDYFAFTGVGFTALDAGGGVDLLDESNLGDGAGANYYWDLANGYHGQGSFDDPTQYQLLNFENFTGIVNGNDHVRGTNVANILLGLSGDDELFGLGGADILEGGEGNDLLDGGTGLDTASYASATAGVTVRLVGGAQNTIGAGTDTLVGIENLTGSAFADILSGNGLANIIDGGGGADMLLGGGGTDTLYGGANDDMLNGGTGADMLYGGAGDDTYRVDDLGDQAFEMLGEGYDTVLSTVDFTLGANLDALYLSAGARIGTGNGLDNVIFGGGAADTLSGLGGNDNLRGLLGRDILNGGEGNDKLIGGEQRDTLTGGIGADQFRFETLVDSGNTRQLADEITDFSHAEGDRIILNLIDANTLVGGDQAFKLIGDAAFNHIAGELRYDVFQGNTYLQGDVNGDGVADIFIRVDGVQSFVNADFFF